MVFNRNLQPKMVGATAHPLVFTIKWDAMTKQRHRLGLATGATFLFAISVNAAISAERVSPTATAKSLLPSSELKQNSDGPPAKAERQGPRFAAFRDYKSKDCYHAATYEAASLCSAWRSTIAAEQATKAAERVNDVALWALIFSAAGVVGLIGTLAQANRSLDESRRSADAAEKAIAQTREVGEAQVRCYLTVSAASIAFYLPDTKPRLSITIKNVGQSPAFNIAWTAELRYSVLERLDRRSPPLATSMSPLTLPPGTNVEPIPEVFDFALDIAEQAHIAGSDDMLGVAAKIVLSATDVFGREVKTQALFLASVSDVEVVSLLRLVSNGPPDN
jgi:hypothetical protein